VSDKQFELPVACLGLNSYVNDRDFLTRADSFLDGLDSGEKLFSSPTLSNFILVKLEESVPHSEQNFDTLVDEDHEHLNNQLGKVRHGKSQWLTS
jgi:hypothetical protein